MQTQYYHSPSHSLTNNFYNFKNSTSPQKKSPIKNSVLVNKSPPKTMISSPTKRLINEPNVIINNSATIPNPPKVFLSALNRPKFLINQRVVARCSEGMAYRGIIKEISLNGNLEITFDDNDSCHVRPSVDRLWFFADHFNGDSIHRMIAKN